MAKPQIDKAPEHIKKMFWQQADYYMTSKYIWALGECKKYGNVDVYIKLLYRAMSDKYFGTEQIYDYVVSLKDIDDIRNVSDVSYYLKEILKYRGVFYLLNIICGFSVFGAPLAVITLLGSGLYAGMIMTVSILEFGFAGGVIGMGLLLPQYLFYIPVWLYSMEQEWKISSEIWRNRGLIS